MRPYSDSSIDSPHRALIATQSPLCGTPHSADHLERRLMWIYPAVRAAIASSPAAAKWVPGGSHRSDRRATPLAVPTGR